MVLVGRVLLEFLDFMKCARNVQMSEKSTIVSMPVFFLDEDKYSDVVQILHKGETWIAEIYTAAGVFIENIEQADLNIVLPMAEGQQSAPG